LKFDYEKKSIWTFCNIRFVKVLRRKGACLFELNLSYFLTSKLQGPSCVRHHKIPIPIFPFQINSLQLRWLMLDLRQLAMFFSLLMLQILWKFNFFSKFVLANDKAWKLNKHTLITSTLQSYLLVTQCILYFCFTLFVFYHIYIRLAQKTKKTLMKDKTLK